jgi:hypothetical protein
MENNKKTIEIIEPELYEYEDVDSEESNVLEEKQHWNEDELEEYLFETAFTIQNNLFDYVNSFALPLCEKIDVNKIIDFIKKID